MKGRAIIPLVLGLGVGIVAIKYVIDVVKRAQGGSAYADQIDVIVASADIQQASLVGQDMVKLIKSPHTPLLGSDRFTKIEDVVGRVTAKSIPSGTPILTSMLAPVGAKPGLGVKIPEGYRAVSVKIDEVTGVAYQLKPGDWVDVLVVMDVRRGRNPETISQVILQRAQVAAVGQELGDSKEGATAKAVKSVTLLVAEADVAKIHLAQTKGRITLSMRGEDDIRTGPVVGASESELTGDSKPDPSALTDAQPVTPPVKKSSPVAAPTLEGEVPHTVMVINNSPKKPSTLRVMFANDRSLKVLSAGDGLTPTATGMLQAGSSPGGAKPNELNAYPPNSAGDGAGRRDPLDRDLDPDDEGGF
ncbi:MAG TPA: Flp pilus assembly protein CpaB [Phycisphaerae bacterium]